MKKVDVSGLEVLGSGATGTVYRIDEEKIIKVYTENVALSIIQSERELAKKALINGISTAISFDLVQVGNTYGIIYELLDAKSLMECIFDNYDKVDDYIDKMVSLIKETHSIKVKKEDFNNTKQMLLDMMNALPSMGIYSEDEVKILRNIISSVPDRDTFLHGDCHTGNVLLQNNELYLIDMMTCGLGHPIFDLTSMFLVYQATKMYPDNFERMEVLQKLSCEQCDHIWNRFITMYLETTDKDIIERVTNQIAAVTFARSVLIEVQAPGLLDKKEMEFFRDKAFEYAKKYDTNFDCYPL